MRAGWAFLQFDWSKVGLSMDFQVFVYLHTKTSFKFLSRQGRFREVFYVVTDLLLQATQRELIVSSPHAVKPTTLSFHLCVNMCFLCKLQSYTESHKDIKKGTKKAVTGLVSVPVSKTLV